MLLSTQHFCRVEMASSSNTRTRKKAWEKNKLYKLFSMTIHQIIYQVLKIHNRQKPTGFRVAYVSQSRSLWSVFFVKSGHPTGKRIGAKSPKKLFFFHYCAPKLLVCVFQCLFNVQKLLFVRKKEKKYFEKNAWKMQILIYIVKNSYIRKITSRFGVASRRG